MAASKTQKSNTRKKSTAKGNVSGKKKTAGRPSTRKNVNTKQSISSGFQTEIVILVLIADFHYPDGRAAWALEAVWVEASAGH